MNKAFVKEPDADERGYCPRCGTLGVPVAGGPLDTHVPQDHRDRLGDRAWYCSYLRCDVAYFDAFDGIVLLAELKKPVYPYDLDAPLCACFGLTYDDVEADVREGAPTRVRALLAKSNGPEARCGVLAVGGQCCVGAVQRLYIQLNAAR